MKPRQKYLILFFIAALSVRGTCAWSAPNHPSIAILKSGYTGNHKPNPLFHSWEMQGALQTLASLGVRFSVLSDKDLKPAALKSLKLLILPDTTDMSKQEADAIKAFARGGGKILATGFSSYRNENDQPVELQNNFQLSDLFGADYLRYNPYPPHNGALHLQSGAIVVLGRNTGIQIHAHPGSTVLATWLDDDLKTPSFPESLDAGIVENASRTAIYAGENLFAPENSHSTTVKNLIAMLLNRLLPGSAKRVPGRSTRFPSLPNLTTISPPLPAANEISVMLPYAIKTGFITCGGPFTIRRGDMHELLKNRWSFTPQDAGSILSPTDPRQPLEIVLWHGNGAPDSPFKFLALRGSVALKNLNGQLFLVNQIPLEDYLAGVVSHEVPFDFRMEALKTMAVVARTFAVKVKSEKKFKGYDICATVACQSYDGLSYESSRSREAVSSTSGDVVTYKGSLADLPYFATCGGITDDIQNVWPLKPVPYLVSVVDGPEPIRENLQTDKGVLEFLRNPPDSYCKASSRFRWSETYSVEELQGLFRESLPVILKHPVQFKKVLDLSVDGRTPHGRVTSLRIVTDNGTFEIPGDQIRWLFSGGKIGLGGLQSTLFVVLPQKDEKGNLVKAAFLGGGWGHGVGLCQFGAEGMAERGFTYARILEHYFPGTSVEKLKNR